MSKQSSTKKQVKFCKVCKDAGKPESEYTSHFTRETSDPSSKVVCPTLLSQQCRYCLNKGHTVKYCKVLKKQQAQSQTQWKPLIVCEVAQKKTTNKFANLDSDDEEDKEEAPIKDEFPAFPALKTVVLNNKIVKSYAAVLSTVPKPIEPKPVTIDLTIDLGSKKTIEQKALKETKAAPWATTTTTTTTKIPTRMNWAMMESEDEEDGDEEEDDWGLPVEEELEYEAFEW